MSSTFKHNKKRNSGLVYEFLIRRLGLSIVDKDKQSYFKAASLIKKYFNRGMPLAKERDIFEAISKSRSLDETTARRVLNEVKKQVNTLDHRKIEIKKSNIIKEIHYAFGQNFFDVHRIPQYRLYASIQMLVEQYKNKEATMNESLNRVHLEEALVKFMKSKEITHETAKGEKVDSLVASLAMKKFEQRYAGSLNEDQKRTLRKFMNYSVTGNSEQFTREMNEEKQKLLGKLSTSKNLTYFKEDKIMLERMNESISFLTNMKDVSTEKSVQDILLYQKLVQEIDSDE